MSLKHGPSGAFVWVALLVAACTGTATISTSSSAPGQDARSPLEIAPAAPFPPVSESLPPRARGGAAAGGVVVRGNGVFTAPPAAAQGQPPPPAAPASDSISLNFVNAPVGDVARVVLGDFLRLNYIVTGAVQGTVTLQTSVPLPRAAVLPTLETALQLSGLALIEADGVYRIVPLADAPRADPVLRGETARLRTPGYGVEIIPLHYVGAEAMQQTLEPIMPAGTVLRADAARNLLLVGGSAEERAAVDQNIRVFDVDALAGMSFALIPLNAGDARNVATELGELIGHAAPGMVRIIPMQRMNALLVISPQARYLDRVRDWIARLDRPAPTLTRGLHIYHVQNGRARDLAAVLGRVLGGGGGEQTSGGDDRDAASQPGPAAPAQGADRGGLGAAPPPEARPLFGGTPPSDARAVPPALSGDLPGDTPTQGIRIVPDNSNNVLIVYGTGEDYQMVLEALTRLDVPPTQVLIEATIAEVTLTDQLSLGLQYYFRAGNNSFVQSSTNAVNIGATLPGFNYLLNSGYGPQIVLNALEAVTTVKVVSDPQILVLNNQTAELKVGDQVPVAVQSAVSVTTPGAPVVNSIEFRDTGVILRVTPRVNQSGNVLMDVSQEVSDVTATTSSTLNSPTIEERKITTSIAVPDGQTVALGGLIKDSRTNGRSGIPYLQDIPLLGLLFRETTGDLTRTELLVLLTPRVVRDGQALRGVTEELRRHMPATAPLVPRPR